MEIRLEVEIIPYYPLSVSVSLMSDDDVDVHRWRCGVTLPYLFIMRHCMKLHLLAMQYSRWYNQDQYEWPSFSEN